MTNCNWRARHKTLTLTIKSFPSHTENPSHTDSCIDQSNPQIQCRMMFPNVLPVFQKCHRFHMSHHLTSAPLWHYDVTVCHFSQLANQTVIVLTHSSQVFHLFTSFTDRRTAFFFRGFLAFFSAAVSQNDVIESADAAQPLAQRLAYASIRHVTGQLAEAGVERRLERQEGGIWQEQDLIEERQHHVGPRLQTERDTDTHDCTCEVLLL